MKESSAKHFLYCKNVFFMKKITAPISIIVPCFNEEKTISQNLLFIYAFLEKHFSVFEIIAVNDGSSDKTEEHILQTKQHIPLKYKKNTFNRGKGSAVRKGILASQYDLVAFLDADLAIPVESLLFFIPEIEKGHDIVIASRFIPGLRKEKPVLWYRNVMERAFRILRITILRNRSVQDTQCGFKLFRRNVATAIFSSLTIDRFAFDSEIIFIALKKGYAVKELSITLKNPTESSVRLIRDPMNMTLDLLRIRMNDMRGKYASVQPKKSNSQTQKNTHRGSNDVSQRTPKKENNEKQ